jgi:hypothetical protein
MLFKEIGTVYAENNLEQINIICEQNAATGGGTYSYLWGLKG